MKLTRALVCLVLITFSLEGNTAQVLEENTFSEVPVTPKVFATSDPTAHFTDILVRGLPDNPFLRVKSFVNQLDGGFQGGLFMNNMAIPTSALLPPGVIFDFSYSATNRGGYLPDGVSVPEVMQMNFAPAILIGEQAYFAIHDVTPTDIAPRFPTSVHPMITGMSTDDFVLATNHSLTLTDALVTTVLDQADPFTTMFGIYASTGGVPTFDLDDVRVTFHSAVPLPSAALLLPIPLGLIIPRALRRRSWAAA